MKQRLAACVIISALARPLVAWASDASAIPETSLDEAFRLLDEGAYAAARDTFATQLSGPRRTEALFGLGRSEQMLHHDPEALLAFRRWLTAEGKDAAVPRQSNWTRQNVVDAVSTLTNKVGHLVIEAPVGAAVAVDSAPVSLDEDDVPVEPGPHLLVATLEDKRVSTTADVAAGTSRRVRLTFPDEASTPAPPSSRTGLYGLGFALAMSTIIVIVVRGRRARPRPQ